MALNTVDPALLERLRARLGASGALEPAEHPRYFEEPRGAWRGLGAVVVRPASVEETRFVVAAAAEARVGLVPWSGGTGLVGGQTQIDGPAPILLSLERLNRVCAASPDDNALVIEAGATLSAAQDAAAAVDRLFPLSLASEGSCTVGGVLSTNAGGVQVLRYGNARELCLGVEAVLPDGAVFHGLHGLRKNNLGFDLRHLLIGAEGTLGVITAAALKLSPRPAARAVALVALESPKAALTLLRRLQSEVGETVSAFELMSATGMAFVEACIEGARIPLESRPPWYALMEVADRAPRDGLEAALAAAFEDGVITDAVVAASEAQADQLWRLREETPTANRKIGALASHDVSTPLSALPDFIAAGHAAVAAVDPRLRVNCFGHVGDGNLHFNLFPPEGETRAQWRERTPELTWRLHDLVAEFGGSVAAEHGVGRAKVAELARYGDPAQLAAMRAIKRALDPLGIMNPGAVLDWASVYD